MSEFYNEMQGIASGLLGEFNQGVIEYVAITPGTGPADDPGPSVKTPHPVNGVARGVSFKYINGTTVLATDLQVTMPGDGVEPDMKGFVTIDGDVHKIVQIMRKPAAGTVVAYMLIVRK